jgi:hypothetical protein
MEALITNRHDAGLEGFTTGQENRLVITKANFHNILINDNFIFPSATIKIPVLPFT